MTVDEWRRKHRRCEFCEHLRHYEKYGFNCKAKQKLVSIGIPRPFCRLFELRKE